MNPDMISGSHDLPHDSPTPVGPQAPSAIVMVRPHRFRPNPQTAGDNAFQRDAVEDVATAAYEATTTAVRALRDAGVTVHLFEDEDALHPDSVFPNNWFSTHADGRIGVYPMYAPNRRGERRADVIDLLRREYRVREIFDVTGYEHDGIFLEGTGAMVLDHVNRVAYASRSHRADDRLVERFGALFGYEPMVFDAVDEDGTAIYHTNVMMCIATEFALVGLDAIVDPERRGDVEARLRRSGRSVIALTQDQLREFAANAIELDTASGRRVLALSSRAAASLSASQRRIIERSCALLPLDVEPLELAGGSVRCMIAGIHLTPQAPVVAD